MNHLYGEFETQQMEQYKVKLHKDLFWLLLYKDPRTKHKYENVNYDKYFIFLMKKIDGLNSLLFYPVELVDLLSLLESAYLETKKEEFDYSIYRKLVLDAHSLVDKICEDTKSC